MLIKYGYPNAGVGKVIDYVGLSPGELKMNRSVSYLCIDSN